VTYGKKRSTSLGQAIRRRSAARDQGSVRESGPISPSLRRIGRCRNFVTVQLPNAEELAALASASARIGQPHPLVGAWTSPTDVEAGGDDGDPEPLQEREDRQTAAAAQPERPDPVARSIALLASSIAGASAGVLPGSHERRASPRPARRPGRSRRQLLAQDRAAAGDRLAGGSRIESWRARPT